MTNVIVVGEWGRGFKTFGPDIRESSAAETPMVWFEEEHIDLGYMEDFAHEGHLGAKAWIAFVETCPNPRWLDYEQPESFIAASGPPPWVDEDTGKALGEIIKHRFGWLLWSGPLDDGGYPELAFAATAKDGFEYFVNKGVDMESITAYDDATRQEFLRTE